MNKTGTRSPQFTETQSLQLQFMQEDIKSLEISVFWLSIAVDLLVATVVGLLISRWRRGS